MNIPTPHKTITVDRVMLSIWGDDVQTDGEVRRQARVILERRLVDSQGLMRAVRSFRVSDLPAVMLAVQRAQQYLVKMGNDEVTHATRSISAPNVGRPMGVPRFVPPIP